MVNGRNPLSLLMWAALAAMLAAGAYLAGSVMARQWTMPSMALPDATETPTPPPNVSWMIPGEPAEGSLDAETADTWQFQGRAGQSLTIEMWLHPGSGSGVEAELAVRLLTPDGTAMIEQEGSVFLPPYLSEAKLPTDGLYQVQVMPTQGAPGRYSLVLALGAASASTTPGTLQPLDETSPLRVTATPPNPSDMDAPAIVDQQFQWPTVRRAISGWTFHDPRNPGHIGLDIAARMWDPIVSIADGVVVFADWGGGYGNLVIVDHEGGWRTYYAHLSEISVENGQDVRQGELLGGAGTTGYSTGPHLHFELRYQDRPVDPHIYLP